MSSDNRKRMFSANKEKIEAEFCAAIARGVTDPVVVLVDPRELAGRLFAVSQSDENTVEEMIAECEQRGIQPSVIITFPRVDALAILADLLPSSSRLVRQASYPTQFAVVVASDELSTTVVPTPEC